MQAIISTFSGTPSPEQAQLLIWDASKILSGRQAVRFRAQAHLLSSAWLLRLKDHPHPRVSREARRSCMRFGITTPVRVDLKGDGA